jgi:hypothetical protein
MPNSTIDTPFCPFIKPSNVLLSKWLDYISSQEITNLLIFSASSGVILKFGQGSWDYYFGLDRQLIFMIEELPHFE